jgi:predicted ATPase/class 3 adenylate cyclase
VRECSQCLIDIFEDVGTACPVCGAKLVPVAEEPEGGEEPKPAEPEAPEDEEFVHFRRQFEERSIYLPEEALRRAREILTGAESELRQATVLQVDMCGFSRISHRSMASELKRLVEGFYKTCTDCILRRGGFVVKLIGDAVLAVFGAPVAFDRDIEAAVWAALDIRDYYAQTETTDRKMNVSIGLATGKMTSGPIEGPSGRTYDILGDPVNLAARLQSAAGENEILACAATHEAILQWFETEPTPPLGLKNVAEAYVAFRILGEKEEMPKRRAFETLFCGREKERAALTEFLRRPALRGTPIAHVVGEAGIGKSRLINEALKRAKSEDKSVWWEASPWGATILLWPVLQWLRREIGLTPQDSPAQVQQAIRRFLAERLPDDDADPRLLEYLFGVPEAIHALREVPPGHTQQNLFGLLRQLLLRKAEAGGRIVLIADDLQWTDPLTGRFLRLLAEWPAGSGLRIVLAYRPGAPPSIARTPEHTHIPLQPLPDRDREALVAQLIPSDEAVLDLRRLILSRAAGNPLFLEEMTRIVRQKMRDVTKIKGEDLTGRIAEAIPVSLHDLIQSRIDQLDARTRQVLQCGSLLGLEFTYNLIELFEIIREGLRGHLQTLRALHYLGEVPEMRDVRYFFTHGLFRDVAYSTLLDDQRRVLHADLAQQIEKCFRKQIQEYYEVLAFHFSRGGNVEKAVRYRVKAADRQAGLGSAATSIENYTEALELLDELPETPERQVLTARLLIRCARLHRTAGDGGTAAQMLARARECAESLGNERLALEAKLEQAVSQLWRGEYKPAREALGLLAREAARLNCPNAETMALDSLGVIHYQRGAYDKALGVFTELESRARACGATQAVADAYNNQGIVHWRQGQYRQALEAYRNALPYRNEAGDKFGLCITLMNIGLAHEQLGEVAAARRAYQNTEKLADRTGNIYALAGVQTNLSNLERRAGTVAAAMEHATRAVELAQAADEPTLKAVAEDNLGLACAARGQIDEARDHLMRACEIARAHGNSEQEISARLSILGLQAEHGTVGDEDLNVIEELIRRAEVECYADPQPRLYRVKARLLEALNPENVAAARTWFEKARDAARDAGNFFEELDAWRDLVAFFERHGRAEEAKQCAETIGEMERKIASEQPAT